MIRANADCSILMDICPHYEKEHPCKECPLFQEYTKHKKLVKDYWEQESKRLQEEPEESMEEHINRLIKDNEEPDELINLFPETEHYKV